MDGNHDLGIAVWARSCYADLGGCRGDVLTALWTREPEKHSEWAAVFNEIARCIWDRLSDTNYNICNRRSSSFSRKPDECLSGTAPDFYIGLSPDSRAVSVDAIRDRQFTKSSFVAD